MSSRRAEVENATRAEGTRLAVRVVRSDEIHCARSRLCHWDRDMIVCTISLTRRTVLLVLAPSAPTNGHVTDR
jgi:hypothetical protein